MKKLASGLLHWALNFAGIRFKLRKSTALKMKRNLKKLQKEYAAGEVTVEEAKQTISSYLGILKHCDSYSLKRTIFGEYGSSEEYEGWFFLQRATTETQ